MITVGKIAEQASEAHPGSIRYGRWVITYLGGVQLGPGTTWKELDDER